MQATANPPVVLFWGIVRFILGITQMTGAVASAVLLIRLGLATEILVALSATTGVSVLSIVLFRVLKVQGEDRP